MMKNFLFSMAMASLPICGVSAASAASLNLITDAPSLEASTAFVDYFDFFGDGELLTDIPEADVIAGVSPVGFTTIDFVVGFSTSDPSDTSAFAFGGFLDISDDNGQFLSGDLLAIGFTEDVVELQFDNLSGSGAVFFGTSVLALVAFDDPLGSDPFASFFDGDSLGASITVSNVTDLAPVPLPASALLLVFGLASFRVFGKRTNRWA
jgi:hypothetical protein